MDSEIIIQFRVESSGKLPTLTGSNNVAINL
jgi:hypothetical protein